MPGIVGIIDPTQPKHYLQGILQHMTTILQHDDTYKVDSYNFKDSVCAARVHLGILNDYRQPVLNEESTIGVFLEGEIFTENSSNQALEILRYYQIHGEDFASFLNGSFLAMIYDRNKRKVIFANDRTGSRPLFYTHRSNQLLFAPEVKSLLIDNFDQREINEAAIAHFLAMGHLLQDETFFKGIRRLPPASTLIYCEGKLQLNKYWRPFHDRTVTNYNLKHYIENLSNLIETAVQRCTMDHEDRRIGLSLSGGFDSRAILHTCHKNSRSIVTLSHGEKPDKQYSDISIARILSAKLKYKHHYYPIERLDLIKNIFKVVYITDGLTDQIGNFCSGNEFLGSIRNDIDVVLRGDEYFGWGGGPFNDTNALGKCGLFTMSNLYKPLMTPEQFNQFDTCCEKELKEISDACLLTDLIDRKDFFLYEHKFPHFWNVMLYLHLAKHEIRNPLLDKDILDFVTTLHPKHRLFRKLFTKTVESMCPELCSLGFSMSGNLVDWQRAFLEEVKLREFAYEMLLPCDDWLNGIFKTSEVEKFLNDCFDKDSAKVNTSADIKSYQYLKLYDRLRHLNLKRQLINSIGSNYVPYKIISPLLRKKKNTPSMGLTARTILMRLLTLRTWHYIFVEKKAF